MQMRELGILDELESRNPNQTYFDVAKMQAVPTCTIFK
jgi:hypothetical protein